jgi:hypothetical protein
VFFCVKAILWILAHIPSAEKIWKFIDIEQPVGNADERAVTGFTRLLLRMSANIPETN